MSLTITVEEVTASLPEWLNRVSLGEEVTIVNNGQAIARFLPALPPRVPGTAAGLITLAPDFDADLPDDVLAAFES